MFQEDSKMLSEGPCKEGLIFVKRSSVSKEEERDKMGFVVSVKKRMQKDKSFGTAMEQQEERRKQTNKQRGVLQSEEKSESCGKRVRGCSAGGG